MGDHLNNNGTLLDATGAAPRPNASLAWMTKHKSGEGTKAAE